MNHANTVTAHHTNASARNQRGSILVMTAGVVLVALALLGALQVGYTYYMKRNLQNAADMASLSGAQALPGTDGLPDCPGALNQARAILAQNLSNSELANQATIQCGQWNPAENASATHFSPGTTNANAVRVEISYAVPVFMPFMSDGTPLTVDAIAVNTITEPVAAFSVGPRLLALDPGGALNAVLAAVGLDAQQLTVLDYNGLANATLTPAGLLQQLGLEVPVNATVADMEGLLDTEANISGILDAAIRAVGDDGLLSVDQLGVLNTLVANLQSDDVQVRLFSEPGGERGLFSLSSVSTDSAGLTAALGLDTILDMAAAVASKQNGANLSLGTGDSVGILDATVATSVVEPPSIGIGPAGTTAHSASIRLFTRLCVDLGNCDDSAYGLNTPLLSADLSVDLPIVIEAVNGTGTLGQVCHRDSDGTPMAEITVQPALLTTCVGRFSDNPADPNYAFSTAQGCAQRIHNDPDAYAGDLINVDADLPLLRRLINGQPTPLIRVTGPLSPIDIAREPETVELRVNETHQTHGQHDLLTQTLSGLTESLVATLANNVLLTSGIGGPTSAERKAIAWELWNQAAADINCTADTPTCRTNVSKHIDKELRDGLDDLQATPGLDPGLLSIVVDLVGGVLGLVTNLLDGLLNVLGDVLLGNGCTVKGLLGSNPSVEGCIKNLADSDLLKEQVSGGGGGGTAPAINVPAILLPLLGVVIQTLGALLDAVVGPLEEMVLSPLLEELGINLTTLETRLISLDCDGQARLVH